MKSLVRLGLVVIVSSFAVASHDALRADPVAPSPAITLDPNLFKVPPPTANAEIGTFSAGKSNDPATGFSIPNTIDLGSAALRFDTSRSALSSGPKVGIDSVEPQVLNPGIPTRKDSLLTPSYFGLTLTTPTH